MIVRLPSRVPTVAASAWNGAFWSGVLNAVGMPIDIEAGSSVPGMPYWPSLASAGVGVATLVVLVLRRRVATVRFASVMFLVNVVAISSCLWITSGHFAAGPQPWVPFQANKLGALAVALLAPSLWIGLVGLVTYIGTALIHFALFPAEIRDRLAVGEPWATLAFGVFAVVLLVYHLRKLALERAIVASETRQQAMRKLARSLIAVRDLTNTPLQTIEFSLPLLHAHAVGAERASARIEHSLERLRELSKALADYTSAADLEPGDESFDPFELLGVKAS